jgi:hypothetical protein
MEFSEKDLEDIRRVAGLLNLTVDELIQQRRQSQATQQISNHAQTAVASAHGISTHFAVAGPGDVAGALAAHVVDDPSTPLPWHHTRDLHRNDSMDVDSIEFEEYGDQPSATSVNSESVHNEETEVILLNPQAVWYDCDAGFWEFDDPAEQRLAQDETRAEEEDDGESFVSVNPMQLDPDSGSTAPAEGPSRESESVGADWAIISSSPGSMSSLKTPMSPTTGSGEKRYHLIAPKTGRSPTQTTSQASSHKIRKKRSPYQGAKKKDTHLTRQVHACVRCRMQRNRVGDPYLESAFVLIADCLVRSGSDKPSRPMSDLPAEDRENEPFALSSLHGDG